MTNTYMQCSVIDVNDIGRVCLQEHGGLFEVRIETVKHRKHSERSQAFESRADAVKLYDAFREEMFALFPNVLNPT